MTASVFSHGSKHNAAGVGAHLNEAELPPVEGGADGGDGGDSQQRQEAQAHDAK